jgi:flagellin-like protein
MSQQKLHPPAEEEFSPIGATVLMILYVIVLAAGWGSVYFGELLARR